MKKETSNKKSKLILIIAIALVALLAVAGVVLALTLGGGDSGEGDAPEIVKSEIYYNVDREAMLDTTTGLSLRKTESDGFVRIRFIVGGEEVTLPITDRKLVNKIDTMDFVCLKLDAEGLIVDASDASEAYVKMFDKVIVQTVEGSTVTTNTSTALNGMKKTFTVGAGVKAWDISKRITGAASGKETTLEMLDQIVVFGTDEETPYEIFMTDRYWESDIYWSPANRQYWNASTKSSTRPAADDGYWYIDLICKGETKTYKVAMQDCIDVLDSKGPTDAVTGVVFDKNGAIVNLFNAGIAARGVVAANNYDITQLSEDGKTFTATRVLFGTEVGKTFTATIDENTEIYNVNGTAKVKGEPTQLQLNDRVLVLQRADGTVHTIFVTNRMVDGPLYYNIEQKWSTTLGHTRTPDADGYYVFNLAANGKIKTVRTKDKTIASLMDQTSMKIFGLKLKGDIVTKYYEAVNVAGNYSFAANNFVTSTAGGVLGTVNAAGTAANGIMAADCKVFDVSGCYKEFKGEKTKVREGDQVVCYQNALGEITHIWVLNRHVKGTTIYWNMNRYYANGETTRTPDENGYYVFNVIKLGSTKVTQLKTKDKDIASRFDKEGSTTAAALKVSGDIIKAAYPAPSAIGGYYRLPGFWIMDKSEDHSNGYRAIASTGAIGTLLLSGDCKIYDFSNTAKVRGEKTKLRANDRVWPIAGTDGNVQIIFVIERSVPGSKLAWLKGAASAPDANGYYNYKMLVNGKVGEYKTNDAEIATYLNGRLSAGAAVTLKGNVITGAYPSSCAEGVRATTISYQDFVSIKDGKINTQRNKVGASDVGATTSVAYSASPKIYMVDASKPEAEWGKQAKLTKGDRIYALSDTMGETKYIFIAYDCTLAEGNMRKCAHCGKVVHWESLSAGYGPAAGFEPETAHYYLPSDRESNSMITLGNKDTSIATEFVFDLNGKTMTRMTTTGNGTGGLLQAGAGSTVIVTDYSKAQTGKMVTVDEINYTTGQALLAVQSGGKMIIEKGLFDASKAESSYTGANSGAISVGGELVVNGGTIKGWTTVGNGGTIGGWGGSKITINGGTIIGGTVKKSISGTGYGGAICTNGDLTVNGGTIKGGTAEVSGDNIYFGRDVNLTISGGTIDGGILVANKNAKVVLSGKPVVNEGKNVGLQLPSDIKIDATGLKTGASVYVDTFGVFTTNFATEAAAQAVLDNGMLKNGGETTMLARNGLAIESKDDGQVHLWKDATKLPTSGNWKLDTDVTVASGVTLNGDLYIDLNNHAITNTGATPVVFTTGVNKLTVDDTSTAKGGVIKATTTKTDKYNAGLIYVGANGQYVQNAGTLDGSNLTTSYTGANAGTLTISNGKIDGASAYGSAIINGGTIKGWTSCGNGSAIGMMNLTSLTINGGEIIGNTVTAGVTGAGYGGTIIANGHLTVTGGTITEGSAAVNGDSIFVNNANAVVSIEGGTISGGVVLNAYKTAAITGAAKIGQGAQYGLKLASGKTVNMTGLTGEVYVDSFGVFSTTFTDAAAAQALIDGEKVKLGKTQATDAEIKVDGTSLMVATKSTIDPTVVNEWNAQNAAEVLGGNVSDNKHKTNLPTSGKWKLVDNVTISASVTMTGDMMLDLNGQTVTGSTGNVIVTAGYDLLIDDLSGKTGDQLGCIKTTATSGSARAAVIYANCGTTASTFTLNNGIIDGTTLTNTQTGLVSGTVTVGNSGTLYASFVMNGGVIKGQKCAPSASGTGGSCVGLMNATSFVMNGGKLIARTSTADNDYVATTGSCISAGSATIIINNGELIANRTMNHGGAIYTTGNLTINGGTIYGAKTQNSSIICSSGTTLNILGGTLISGTTVNNPGNGAIDKNGGTITVGGNAVIGGGINIRGSAKLVLKETPVVDCKLGAEQKFNVRINGGSIYLNNTSGTAIATANGNYSLKYKCNTVVGVVSGNDNVIEHNVVDGVCKDCGFMEGAWTNANALPTSGKHTLAADVTLTSATVLTGDLTLNLNGHTVTRQIASTETADMFAINTNGHKLVINDASGKYGENLGKIKATVPADFKVTSKAGLIYVPTGAVTVNNGIIDGSNLVHKASGYAGVITTDTGKITINGGEIKGMRNLGTASASSGATSSDHAGNCLAVTNASGAVTVNGGKIVAPASTASNDYVSGAGACIISKAPVTITGGELIGSMVANHGGVVLTTSNFTMTGGVLKNGNSNNSGILAIQGTGTSSITGGVIVNGKARANAGALGGHNIDKHQGTLIIGGDAIIGGGIGVRGGAKLVLTGKPIINDGMQKDALGDIRVSSNNAANAVYLNDTTGTPVATKQAANAYYDVEYNTDGTIKGLKAVEAAKTWTTGNALPTSGTWKLGADIKLEKDDTSTTQIENCIVTTGNLVIDLNGHTITRNYKYSQGGYMHALHATHTVIITDTSAEGKGAIKSVGGEAQFNNPASVAYLTGSGHLILAGGALDGSATKITNEKVGSTVAPSGTVYMNSNTKLTVIGGTINGSPSSRVSTSGNGGTCVGGFSATKITVWGGKLLAPQPVEDQPVARDGGCIKIGGDVFVHGGEILGSKAAYHGGTIQANSITMTGGLIHGGSAGNSGNLAISGTGTSTITGGVIIDGKFTKSMTDTGMMGGSNIDFSNGTMIIGGNAVIGGGVCGRGGSYKLVIKDRAVIDMTLQDQQKFHIRTRTAGAANAGLYFDTTRIGGAAEDTFKLVRGLDGEITGIAKAN